MTGINLMDQIVKGQSLAERMDKTLILFLMAVLCFLFRNKIKFFAYFYAVASILALLDTSEAANLTGVVFLYLSLNLFKTNILMALITLTTFITIGSKVFSGFSANQILGLTIGYIYSIANYYIVFQSKHKPKSITPESKIIIRPDLKPIDIYIVQQIHKGISRKAIAFDCEVNKTMIDSRIKQLKKKLKTTTTIEMLNECLKVGIMDIEVDRRELT